MQVLLADDHRLFQDAVVAYLGRALPDVDVVCVDNMQAVHDRVAQITPDLLLLDWKMPGMAGMSSLRQFVAEHPRTRVAVLSGTIDANLAEQVRQAGAMYMPKTMEGRLLVEQISACLGLTGHAPLTDVALTRREKDVLRQLRLGLGNKEIALLLGVQVITVKLHVRNLCRKLGAKNRTQLALYAQKALSAEVRE